MGADHVSGWFIAGVIAQIIGVIVVGIYAWLVWRQVQLHTDQLRLYYEPGVFLRVHDQVMGEPPGVKIKVYATSQTPVFRLWIGWEEESEKDSQLAITKSEHAPPQIPSPKRGSGCARIAPGEVGWCLLEDMPSDADEASLMVKWQHRVGDEWRAEWKMTRMGANGRNLTPVHVPKRVRL